MLKLLALGLIVCGVPVLQGTDLRSLAQVNFSNPSLDVTNWQAVEAHLQGQNIAPEAVTNLTLERCNLTQLPAWVIQKMPNLIALDIKENNIKELPETIEHLGQLVFLEAQHNHLTTLPASLSRLNQLYLANFSHNKLKNLSPSSFKLPKLEVLNLSHNQIATLPDLSGLANLQTLSLSGNEGIRLEPDFAPLTSLRQLDLSHCHLKTVPSFLGDISSLSKLNLEGNPLLEKGLKNKWGKDELKKKFEDKVRF
ncbi:MAG: leucine-rich repeat domain-containing protein [Holosporaceae bacterium]